MQRRRALQCVPVLVLIAGCSTLMGQRDPVQVRMASNPEGKASNCASASCAFRTRTTHDEFNGIYLALEVRGVPRDAVGTVPASAKWCCPCRCRVGAATDASGDRHLPEPGPQPHRLCVERKDRGPGLQLGAVRVEGRTDVAGRDSGTGLTPSRGPSNRHAKSAFGAPSKVN